MEIWYRYEDYCTAPPVDEFENRIGESEVHIRLRTFEVVKHTPKGVWLIETIGTWKCEPERFVLKDSHKRFACPTIELALESFEARKLKQARIYRARIKVAEEALRLARKEPELDLR